MYTFVARDEHTSDLTRTHTQVTCTNAREISGWVLTLWSSRAVHIDHQTLITCFILRRRSTPLWHLHNKHKTSTQRKKKNRTQSWRSPRYVASTYRGCRSKDLYTAYLYLYIQCNDVTRRTTCYIAGVKRTDHIMRPRYTFMDHKYIYYLNSSICFGLLGHLQGYHSIQQADPQDY
jgi:hypothetical protein